jgi:hypothetical protein
MPGLKSGPISEARTTAVLRSKNNSSSQKQKQQRFSEAKTTAVFHRDCSRTPESRFHVLLFDDATTNIVGKASSLRSIRSGHLSLNFCATRIRKVLRTNRYSHSLWRARLLFASSSAFARMRDERKQVEESFEV